MCGAAPGSTAPRRGAVTTASGREMARVFAGTRFAPEPTVTTSNPRRPEKGFVTWLALAAGLGVLLLGALIVRELLGHPKGQRAVEAVHPADAVPPPAQATRPTPPATKPAAPARLASAPAPSSAPARAPAPAPAAAQIIAGVAEDPQAFGPSSSFAPPAVKTETFIFNALPPFNSTELKRSRVHHDEWELDALHGPKMEDLAPAGGVHEAVTAKDAQGTELSKWYVIDSGPLAPAFATQSLQALRVMSRAYVEANRDQFPAEVMALVASAAKK